MKSIQHLVLGRREHLAVDTELLPPYLFEKTLICAQIKCILVDFKTIDFLKENHRIDIQFDGESLKRLGINPSAILVTCTVKGTPLRSGLKQLLARVNNSLTFERKSLSVDLENSINLRSDGEKVKVKKFDLLNPANQDSI